MMAKKQRRDEAARLLDELARRTGIVHRVARGRCFGDRLLHEIEHLLLRYRRRVYAHDRRRIELLEVVDALRNDLSSLVRDRGGGQEAAVRRADVVAQHLRRIEAIDLQHLGDHLVGAPADREVVDVTAAQRRRQRGADVLLGEAERCQHVAVDLDRGLRFVDLEVGVDEEEHPARPRLRQHRLRDLVEVLVGLGRLDDDLHRQPARARQRRELERGHGARRRWRSTSVAAPAAAPPRRACARSTA